MATTVTLDQIRDQIVTLIRALSPTTIAHRRFDLVPDDQVLREFAAKAGESLRVFEVLAASDANGATTAFSHDARQTIQDLAIQIAYPRAAGAYGRNDLRDLERIMREDAAQIRAAVFSPANALDGQITRSVVIRTPIRSGPVWFQTLTVTVEFTEAQILAT